jgi:hypothetical protein
MTPGDHRTLPVPVTLSRTLCIFSSICCSCWRMETGSMSCSAPNSFAALYLAAYTLQDNKMVVGCKHLSQDCKHPSLLIVGTSSMLHIITTQVCAMDYVLAAEATYQVTCVLISCAGHSISSSHVLSKRLGWCCQQTGGVFLHNHFKPCHLTGLH